MGTEVHCKNQVPGYYSVRDMNEDSNSSSRTLFYGDKLLNWQYCNGIMLRTVSDKNPGYEKDVLKHKMLEHEAIFKNQVYELHRLYRVQRDMMEEVKRKELYKHRISIETSSSSSLIPSQMPSDEGRNWHLPSFPVANSDCVRPSMLGSEVNDSPLSCTKRNSSQAGWVPYQNKCSSEDCGFSDSRPSKVRKKLLDLQLPADEYIDTDEEEFQDTKIPAASSIPQNGNHTSENNIKMVFPGGMTNYHKVSSSASYLKSSHGLADLNEPIQVEEGTSPKSVDFPRYSAYKLKSQFVDVSPEFSQNSQHGSSNGKLNYLPEVNKGIRRGWLSYMYESGNSGKEANSFSKIHQPEQLPITSQPTPVMLEKAQQHHVNFPADVRKEEPWTERSHYEFSAKSPVISNYNYPGSAVASHISNPHPLFNSSDVNNSWSHAVTSWGKVNASLTQKLSVPTRPSLVSETLSRSSQPSAQTPEVFSDKCNVSSRLNPGFRNNLPTYNGFYHGSSSGSKELSANLSSTGYDNLKSSKIDEASKHFISHASSNFLKDTNGIDLKPGKEFDLNVVLPNNLFNEAPPQGLDISDGKRKSQGQTSGFPWLREKAVRKNETSGYRKDLNSAALGSLQSSCSPLLRNGTMKDSNLLFPQNISSASGGHNVGAKRESDRLSNGKILGFPIFGKLYTSKNETSLTPDAIKHDGKHRGIDINVACDLIDYESDKQTEAEDIVMEKRTDIKFDGFRDIDLNSCISGEEDLVASSPASTSGKVKSVLNIDLEVPIVETEDVNLPGEEHNQHAALLESLHHKTEHLGDEVRNAAEAIIAIYACDQDIRTDCGSFDPSETSSPESLLWLAEVISSSAEDLEREVSEGLSCRHGVEIKTSRELDDYEVMILQLPETKEEDYMPKSFVPEIQDAEEIGATSLQTRPRRGQSRRGRQRRDFQRDILPGLVSLSRHEVTEDIQTFGGLMRATGHQWSGGLTRRNGTRSGAARGRRRCVVDPAPLAGVAPVCTPLVQQLNSIEVGLEDRSLTGWGKTTRRPRRQRCAAGNNLAVALT